MLHIITSLENGGAEAALYRLVKYNRENIHQVVALKDLGYHGPRLRSLGIEVTTLDMPKGRLTPKGVVRLCRLIRSSKPDVIQTWMYHADLVGGMVAKLVSRRPVVWGVRHSTYDSSKTSRSTRAVVWLCAQLSGWVPKLIINCSQKSLNIHALKGYPRYKMRHVPNGYDFTVLRRNSKSRNILRATWGVGCDERLLGTVARWDPQKDHENLIRAFARLKTESVETLRLVFVGPAMHELNDSLRDLIIAHDLLKNVILLGERDDVPAVMNALDIHVLPSSYGEAFPNVVVESMACGTPPVVTDVGDASLIAGDWGWVCPPNDPDGLARVLSTAVRAMDDPAAWSERQQACIEHVGGQFDVTTMVAGYTAVWREALS